MTNVDRAASDSSIMTAARIHAFGNVDAIVLEEIERPTAAEGEVLVRVEAAGVGPWDAWIRAGKSVLPQPLPLTLGSDISGIVEAVGPAVTGLHVGDPIFGVTNARFTGGYAEYAVASADMIARRPASLGVVEAAAVPVVAVTAWQALFEQANVQHGDTVLIHGGAGAVGAYTVQFAKQAGALVIATASERDRDFVEGLGADKVVNYRSARFEDIATSVDAVIDLVGGETQKRSFSVLRPGGVLISAVSQPDQTLAQVHGVRAAFFLVEVTRTRLETIVAMIDEGRVIVDVGLTLPIAEARTAHHLLEGRSAKPRGKIVLTM
ncbi:NADP-dependent oxidoreductase [Methylobacterium sp. CB376]|uniref:NADP-dependent oxidoreductase n=1 Tax=unclassified Methylobacterium TaxID=2615210 RepID=UPI000152DA62|nr:MULTISPECIES: NADP-dependent oxidoreductase [Methylobacterium]WFT79108.1 NADP-dependent oxidoreductase [Methylobacterium nodulans]